jgi:hypothetical protein
VAKKKKPFELYSTALSDGRRVVRITSSRPVPVTIWLIASGKSEALKRCRDLGVTDPHVSSSLRPLSIAVDIAGEDPDGGVFWKDVYWRNTDQLRYFPLRDLSHYMSDPERLS